MTDIRKGPFFRIDKVPVREIQGSLEGLAPLKDETFSYLLERALQQELPVYFAAVPLRLIDPFDIAYDPSRHPVGAAAIKQTQAAWLARQYHVLWVYPKAERFVLSDDYIAYFACLPGQPDYVPCCILRKPSHPELLDLQGPLAIDKVKKLLGFA